MTEEKATEKQIKFMSQLGILPTGLGGEVTKQEARGLIQAKLDEPNGDAKPGVVEVLRDGAIDQAEKWDEHVHKTLTAKKDNDFHLTEENINLGAIDMTMRAGYNIKDSMEFMQTFKMMKRIIVTGE